LRFCSIIRIFTRWLSCSLPVSIVVGARDGHDLENITGDLANDYRTIPIVYGETAAKRTISILLLLIIPVYYLVNVFDVGYMDIYFYVGFIIMIFFGIQLWKSNSKPQLYGCTTP
jgi:4-hydroxybenzoate polyprenyltransferase